MYVYSKLHEFDSFLFSGRVPLRQQRLQTAQSLPDTVTEDSNINGARVRIRPVGTIGNTDPTRIIQNNPQPQQPEVTSPRARQPFVTRLPNTNRDVPDDTRLGPTGVRVVRVRPTNRPFRTENFTPIEFNPGAEATPPPVISRVRGRPIVPDDFPGTPLAIRGKTPDDEVNDFEDLPTGPGSDGLEDSFSSAGRGRFPPSSTTGNSKTRTRVRIVPTGNRARRPLDRNPSPIDPQINVEPSEEPRASLSSSGRPLNRLPFSSTGGSSDSDPEVKTSGLPRRRLRPVNRIPQAPVRTLRPFTTEELVVTQPPTTTRTPSTRAELVPTAPSVTRDKARVQDLLRQTLLGASQQKKDRPKTISSGDDHFDPNHLLAHVQAVKAAEENDSEELKRTKSGSERTTQKALDDSEESNLIPLSAIPTDTISNTQSDSKGDDITVISLKKDKGKQNFQGFVDSDLIDDNRSPPVLQFIPTRPPPPPPRTTTTTTLRTTTTTTTTTRRTTEIDNQDTTSEFRPTSRVTQRPSTSVESTTTPFVRIPFGPFSLSEKEEQNSKSNQPKVSVSVSTSLSKSSSTSTSSESSTQSTSTKDINDELDRLQSSLDPWARIQQQLKEKENQQKQEATEEVTEEPPTTTRISLFKIRTLAPLTTRSTTTFKPRSLADLFKHREGQKVGNKNSEEVTIDNEPITESTISIEEQERSSLSTDRAPFSPTPSNIASLFKNRLNKFTPKVTTQETTITTTTTTPRKLSGFKPRAPKGPTVKDLLSSIPKDDLSSLLPKDFSDRRQPTFGRRPPPSSSIKQDDVSKFLPAGFKLEESTTSTTTDTSLIADILSSIEQDDLAKLLPNGYKPERPKPPRLFRPNSNTEKATLPSTTEKEKSTKKSSILGSLKFDDVSAFLPPGFNPDAGEESATSTTTEKPDFKLDISSLFDDIKTDDVSSFLPPGFGKDEKPPTKDDKIPVSITEASTIETEKTTEKIVLKFPTRPGGSSKNYESSTKATGISGPPPFVPKIKSFEDR